MRKTGNLSLALVTETYAPEVNGVAMTLGRLASGLLARGHRVSIVRPHQKHEMSGPGDHGQLLTPGLPIPRYPELRFGLPAAGQLRAAWSQRLPDIVHIATEGPLGFSALEAARQLDIPVVSTFHTNFHSYSRHYGIGWLKGSIENYLRWFHNRTATTLVPTAALAEDLSQRGFRAVGVLARGVDTRLFNPGRRTSALRKSWGASERDLVVAVVGRIAPEKNLKLALRAYAAIHAVHPNARMVCVGDGPLRESLSRHHPECRFVGAKQGEELAAHYASADLFLFPSLTETFGNVVSEALACGLPVAAFDCAAASSLIENGRNGIKVPPGDHEAFISAAGQLADQAKDHYRMWRVTCPASVSHLDWERIHDSYATVLQGIVDAQERQFMDAALFRFAPD
jgi:glycosyltransferase involved in cell wall biosynthesis